jgi:hypothetical protein
MAPITTMKGHDMTTINMWPTGYRHGDHDPLDPFDAAADIADELWDGGSEDILDLLITQLEHQIRHARRF